MQFYKCLSNCRNIQRNSDSIQFNYLCNDSTTCKPIIILLQRGIYYFDLFGASGGGDESIHKVLKPGYGGEASGYYILNKSTKLFLYIGGEGETGNELALGGWNGGGDGAFGFNANDVFGGGGGGTDIRNY